MYYFMLFCKLSQLFDKSGEATIKWLSQDEAELVEKAYFGQASPNNKECSCGDTNTCAGDDGKEAMQKRCVCHIIIVSSFMCSNQVLFLSFS
jgi:hypothetical protein